MSGDHNMYASGSGDGQRTGWRKRTIQEMAREAGFQTGTREYANGVGSYPVALPIGYNTCLPELEAFAALVREDERDKWMERTVILIRGEREACAKLCEEQWGIDGTRTAQEFATAIRARGQA